MKKTVLVFLTVLFLAGCAMFPKEEMIKGRSMAEIIRALHYVEPTTKIFPAPHDPKENMTVLEYSMFKPSGCQNCRPEPHWILFFKDKLVSFDLGTAREAEYRAYKGFIKTLFNEKKITYAEETKKLQAKYTEFYGNDPERMQFGNLVFSYRMVLAEKIDKGEISQTEANYLLTQKEYELNQARRQLDVQRAQAEAAEAEAFAVGWGALQSSFPKTSPKTK